MMQTITLDPQENPVGTVPNGIAPFKFRFDPESGQESLSFVIELPQMGHIFWEHMRRVDKHPLKCWAAGMVGYPPYRCSAVAVRPIVDGDTAVGYEIRISIDPPWWFNPLKEQMQFGHEAIPSAIG